MNGAFPSISLQELRFMEVQVVYGISCDRVFGNVS